MRAMKVKTSFPAARDPARARLQRIRRGLIRGDYEPGQKLTIAKLSTELGVSATPVREALRRLAAERALLTYPNSLTAVPRPSRARQVLEIRAIRERLEGFAAQLTATRWTRRGSAARRSRNRWSRRASAGTSAHHAFQRGVPFQRIRRSGHPGPDQPHLHAVVAFGAPSLMVLFKPEHIFRYPFAAQNRRQHGAGAGAAQARRRAGRTCRQGPRSRSEAACSTSS